VVGSSVVVHVSAPADILNSLISCTGPAQNCAPTVERQTTTR
jgi:hypothetical protein